jgi:type VI secretion system secreted protein VgrG
MGSATYTQVNRPLAVTTPLGADALLLVGFTGHEGISQLYSFHLDLLAENGRKVPFEQLLGQPVTVALRLPSENDSSARQRYFHGICCRFSQGESDERHTDYKMEVVPHLWLWTRKAQSRIFQHLSVPQILKEVLKGLNVEFQLSGTFPPRDYCVQYRETDFAFVSRLMEEEGIFYFFKHTDRDHVLVVANAPQSHPDVPAPARVAYVDNAGGLPGEDCVYDWEKVQEVRSGAYALRDYCFERSEARFDVRKTILDRVRVGGVDHALQVGANQDLEVYDYPGEYAQRFDGTQPGGGERGGSHAEHVNQIGEDGQRTAQIRMQEEAARGLAVHGSSTCRQFVSGHKFTLAARGGAARALQADGPYVLAGVTHHARAGGFRSGGEEAFEYHNSFTGVPLALPFRPPRTTPKPLIPGPQTAVVVGPQGEEIFTDKYGRVKVQFHWDRQGQKNADSSCWVRVGTFWAGKQWGAVHLPRVGQEVIVAFEEGDPDQPLVIGSVYNDKLMPPYPLPDHRTRSGVKSRSTPDGGEANFNELRFEDKKDHEDVYFHAEKDFHRVVENDDDLKVGHDQTVEVKNDRTETVKEGNETVTVEKGDRTVTVSKGNDTHQVKEGDRTVQVAKGKDTLTVKADRTVTVQEGKDVLEVQQGNRSVVVGQGDDTHQIKQGKREVKIEMGDDSLKIQMGNQTTKLDLGKSETEAMQSIELKVGQSSIKLEQSGVTIKGLQVKIEGQIQSEMKGALTTVKADGMLTLKGGITMIN